MQSLPTLSDVSFKKGKAEMVIDVRCHRMSESVGKIMEKRKYDGGRNEKD
ncbi:MAG: hypothetical protein GTN74_16370 [Proteobacteria bacterium]|nr:hypothetical protein [Pseudomonadota bacterium]